LEPSESIAWKTFSKTSRVPSSWRMVAGSPSSERTVASLRTAWITSARLRRPLPSLSIRPNAAMRSTVSMPPSVCLEAARQPAAERGAFGGDVRAGNESGRGFWSGAGDDVRNGDEFGLGFWRAKASRPSFSTSSLLCAAINACSAERRWQEGARLLQAACWGLSRSGGRR
jgi:hypothetical protein